jgi:hypothetical protein
MKARAPSAPVRTRRRAQLKPTGQTPAEVRAAWAARKTPAPAPGIGRKAAKPPAQPVQAPRPPQALAPVQKPAAPKPRTFAPPGVSIVEAMDSPTLFQGLLDGPSWEPWRTLMTCLWGLPLSDEQLVTYRHHTHRQTPPTEPFRSANLVIGRRGGKSRALALIACYLAVVIDHTPHLVPGETPVIAVIAADRKQARIILNYIVGTLRHVPALAALIQDEGAESVQLSNRVSIEVQTGSIGAPRGRTYISVLADEIAFWSTDGDSASPDVEIINAVRPGLTSIPYSLLLIASSPYAKRGVLYTNYSKYFGKDDAKMLVWQGTTEEMNSTLIGDPLIEEMYREDPERASAEHGALFRSDIVQFITREAVEDCLSRGIKELPPFPGMAAVGFVDPSGGSADSMTLGIAYMAEDGTAMLAAVREVVPPFSPDDVAKEFATLLKSYGITRVTGDAYSGEWCRERLAVHGIGYDVSKKSKSVIYTEFLPALNGKRVRLLDIPRLIGQAVGLERRTSRGGRDSVDHAPGGRDDVINAAAGALVQCLSDRRPALVQQSDMLAPGDLPSPMPVALRGIFATIAVTKEGQAAILYVALPAYGLGEVRMHIIDFEICPIRASLFWDVNAQLLTYSAQYRRPALAFTTEAMVRQAEQSGFNFDIIPPEIERSEDLFLSAASHFQLGRIKLGAAAYERRQASPLASSLDFRGGEKANDPLRVASLWAVALACDMN